MNIITLFKAIIKIFTLTEEEYRQWLKERGEDCCQNTFRFIDIVFPLLEMNWSILTCKQVPDVKIKYYEMTKKFDVNLNAFYNTPTKTIYYDFLTNENVKYHEIGHFLHHVLFNWKDFNLPLDLGDNSKERFANVFADSMIRLSGFSKLTEYNLLVINLIQKERWCMNVK